MESLVNQPPKSVAIVTPAFDEEECLAELARRLRDIFASEASYNFRCIIVENGSTDRSWQLIKGITEEDPRFVGVRLSRNFGADGGITAGLEYVVEDAAVIMTADLQDPPEMIPQFLRAWEEGYENVYGVITSRRGVGLLRRLNSRLFYWLAARATDNVIPQNASDFRLLDRRAYEAVRDMRERSRMMRGLAAWIGFRSLGLPMERPERFAGASKASSKTVIRLAANGIFSNSTKPLRFITWSGILLSALAVVAIIVLTLLWVARGVPFAGFGTLVSISLLAFGLLALMIGVVAEYVGLIFEEVRRRPTFIVRETTKGF